MATIPSPSISICLLCFFGHFFVDAISPLMLIITNVNVDNILVNCQIYDSYRKRDEEFGISMSENTSIPIFGLVNRKSTKKIGYGRKQQ